MKRLCVFVIALFCTLTASAADSAINRVTLGDGAVTVNVTTETDCALTVALYDADGRMLGVQTREVGATAGRDVSVTIPDGIPAGNVAKAFLTDADNKPVCNAGSSSDSGNGGGNTPTTDDVYAILYADGTLVFQYGDTPQAGRQVRETYAVDLMENYRNKIPPWFQVHGLISRVEFADTIQPNSTAHWFYKCTKLREFKNIKNLDTANVTDMSAMFYRCGALSTLDVSHFNTANVTDMDLMFFGCGALSTLDLSNFNTANVTDMRSMFFGCGTLSTLDLSHFNTANVTSMSYMFYRCGALSTLNVSHFNTANVTDMTYMFSDCYGLTTIYASEQFVTSQLNYTPRIFENCSFLVGGNGTTYDYYHSDKEYAHIDGGASAPGYFTAK